MRRKIGRTPRSAAPLGCVVGLAAIVASALLVPAVWLATLAAPQPTCDVLAPFFGCKDGAAPTCKTLTGRGRRGGTSYRLHARCADGRTPWNGTSDSSTPIWIFAASLMGVVLVVFCVVGLFLARARRRRAPNAAAEPEVATRSTV